MVRALRMIDCETDEHLETVRGYDGLVPVGARITVQRFGVTYYYEVTEICPGVPCHFTFGVGFGLQESSAFLDIHVRRVKGFKASE